MTNCFEYRCPTCGNTDQIDISAEVWVRITLDGTDADTSGDGSHLWDHDSPAICGACGHHGPVADFDPDLSPKGGVS
jgi:hypothetical protein